MRILLALMFVFSLFFGCASKQNRSSQPSPSPPAKQPAVGPTTTTSQPDHHDHTEHKEVKIPTPLAELQQAPLDIAPACLARNCDLLLLYNDHLDVLDWKTSQKRSLTFPPAFFASVKSRSPSGKILAYAQGYLILCNSLTNPVYFSADLKTPAILSDTPAWLPLAQAGFNWFRLQDGRFYDFERYASNSMIAVDTSLHLNVAQAGNLVTSTDKAGATLCVSSSAIYTSSPNLPSDPDAILKFDTASLKQVSSHPVDGQILDLCIADLNQDGEVELLVTLKNGNGIRIDVMEPF
jgi:hypothetical protein